MGGLVTGGERQRKRRLTAGKPASNETPVLTLLISKAGAFPPTVLFY